MQDDRPGGTIPPQPTPTGRPGPDWRSSSLFTRAVNILTQPGAEWARAESEPNSVGRIMMGYVLPLAAIPPIALLIGMLLNAGPAPISLIVRVALPIVIVFYLVLVAVTFALANVIDALAPHLGGTKNSVQAAKLAAYSSTPLFVGGVVMILVGSGNIGMLWFIAGLAYGAFILFLGLPRLMRVAPDKGAAYVGVAVVAWVILFYAFREIAGLLLTSVWGGGFYF